MIAHDNNGNINNKCAAIAAQSIAHIIEVLLTSLLDEGMSVVEARSLLYYLRSEMDVTTALCIMKHQMNQLEKFVAIDETDNFLYCLDENCSHRYSCANHRTATVEMYNNGETPDLIKTDMEGIWKCTQSPTLDGRGALLSNGTYAKMGTV